LSGGAGSDVRARHRRQRHTVNAGAGTDTIDANHYLTAADQIDGGAGSDAVTLAGDYSTRP
jgi:hypothetical protein